MDTKCLPKEYDTQWEERFSANAYCLVRKGHFAAEMKLVFTYPSWDTGQAFEVKI